MIDFIIFVTGFVLGLALALWLKDCLHVDIRFDRDGIKSKKFVVKDIDE